MVTGYRVKKSRIVWDGWGTLSELEWETQSKGSAEWKAHKGELYDTGNAAAVLLYNRARRTVLLIRQFRIATVYNGHPSGMLTEVCAGKIEGKLTAEQTIIKEIKEETGYDVKEVERVLSLYMSPGAFTEKLELFVAEYGPQDKQNAGGGLKEEGEDIAVREVPFDEALAMIARGEIIDAKTVILLQHAALNMLLTPTDTAR